MTEQTLGTQHSIATIDNGPLGTRQVTFSTGRLAKQAAGSVLAQLGDTVVLAATTASKTPKDQLDFFPLTVDVEERMYAAGRIPGSFFRREGRPSEDAILTCRLIDRPLRPSFVKGLRNEIQVVVTVLALDPAHPYDVVAINAASLSTKLSGLPFSGPIGATRVAHVDGVWVAFPTQDELERATFDMVVAGRALPDGEVAIMMVEAEATEHTIALIAGGAPAPTEEVVASGLEAAKPAIRELCRAQDELAAVAAKPVEEFPVFLDYQDDAYAAVDTATREELAEALHIAGKAEREEALDRIKDAVKERLAPQFEGREKEISAAFRSVTKKEVRARVLRDQVRHHAEHAAHGAGAGHPVAGQDQALHAQLQLPAVLDRGDRPGRRAEAARDRPRCPRRTGADPGAAQPGGVPLRDPAGVRGVGLQRVDLDGLGVRLDDVAAVGGGTAEGFGRRHRDGPDLG